MAVGITFLITIHSTTATTSENVATCLYFELTAVLKNRPQIKVVISHDLTHHVLNVCAKFSQIFRLLVLLSSKLFVILIVRYRCCNVLSGLRIFGLFGSINTRSRLPQCCLYSLRVVAPLRHGVCYVQPHLVV
jgi:hypothetical protein